MIDNKAKEWLKDSKIGYDIWEKKYRYNNETFDEWLDRVSGNNELIKQLIYEKKFLFGGRILSNRGLDKLGKKITLSNCYVLPAPKDNLESIFDTGKEMARTFSYGGGVGIDIGNLRPSGSFVNNAAERSSGAVSFMDLYSQITGTISQNGRRGALMISIPCDHPDIEEFINVKSDLTKVTKANISIRVTDDFMDAVINDAMYDLHYHHEYGEEIVKTVRAKDLYHKFCEMNWRTAEPAMLFWDNIENYNLLNNNSEYSYAGTNPCAEEPLPAYGACLLGSLNLSEFVTNPYTNNASINWDQLRETVYIAIGGLNEVLDEGINLHPLYEQCETARNWRQIGLGFMGLADMLTKLGVSYGSDEAVEICHSLGSTIAYESLYKSALLAKHQGPYPKYTDAVLDSSFFNYHKDDVLYALVSKYGLRNSQLLTCAPTGTLSTMLNISGGIEPFFAVEWTRKTESLHGEDVYYKEHPGTITELLETQNIDTIPSFVKTAADITPLARIRMQSVWQSHIDASISSTINLPKEATIEDIEQIYINAWKSGLKGITVYRAGCEREGILTTESGTIKEESTKSNEPKRGEIIQVKDTDTIGFKRKLVTGCGSLHCAAYFDVNTGDLVETYLSKGSTGGCNNFMIGLSRLISMSARAGVQIDEIVDQLMSTGACPSYARRAAIKGDTSKGSCCPMAVGYALKSMWEELNTTELIQPTVQSEVIAKKKNKKTVCPECGEELVFEGGCNICKSCGWSKCD